jgi:membrane-bound lytic murein transglycosylase D
MRRRLLGGMIALALLPLAGRASEGVPAAPILARMTAADAALPAPPVEPPPEAPEAPAIARNGRDIYQNFLAGRADTGCDAAQTSQRWQQHFSHAPARMADRDDEVLPLFGYVVDQLREAGLPTEFALIPFVESGYHPAARNGSGPAGLWQFVASTARNHQVAVGKGYDGRLSAVDSTDAAVRYLKTLYGMFGGDWRLTIMAYNAGEYRLLQSLRRGGMNAQNANPAKLPGLSPVTYAYVEKLHALACVLDKAQAQEGLMAAMDRSVPILAEHTLPAGASLAQWARQRDLEPAMVSRLNPALAKGNGTQRSLLAPAIDSATAASADAEPLPTLITTAVDPAEESDVSTTAPSKRSARSGKTVAARTHTVRNGESAWTIAKRYGIPVKTLLSRNGLKTSAVLKPGMVLAFDSKP